MKQYDLVIVGAGPAGMAAATAAAEQGLTVTVLDEQAAPGGQIYRAISAPAPRDERILGPDYYHGCRLLAPFHQASVDYLPSATVWEITHEREVRFSAGGQARTLRAGRILLATGAQERPVPFPGWQLPGVMSCGAAQIMLKTSGLTPPAPLVLAGSGPLLLLIALQLHRAGVELAAVLDTTPRENYLKAGRHIGGALRGWKMLLKGLDYMARLKGSGVPCLSRVSGLRAEAGADGRLARVHFSHKGKAQTLDATSLLVHQGVVPNVQLSRSIGIDHQWDEQQLCWRPVTDAWGETDVPGIFIAGDGAGIGGAVAAEQAGRLASWQVAHQLGNLNQQERDRLANPVHRVLPPLLAIRPFLDVLYQPAKEFLTPSDDTLVCRCEEVTAGDIRRFAQLGCTGPNQTKSFSRVGMGPCQGRMCGLTVAQIIADTRQTTPAEVGYYRIRSPIKPLTLQELANLGNTDQPKP
ncbi:NAD(P)/FAD-dependent oxidoreductase [Oceanimonas sp. MB9]|uniref:FAD/NAD(P)-dependent oxidoreductase n=1 Tax=Oceanimonas sp. MB9 TaxID=2588453 RepID=UPI0013F60356|nr:NAD(P)/FAD-dependent oxidoreductase [Oceanimonas sp. MB9]NHH99446.1 Hydrogen cyanide synthase subunit HcnB [Oceanimonas sp. MB9]